jgi:membrane associated rhomboid family serine protease
MFPIRDHNPSTRTPFVTWALIAINVVVFLSYAGALGTREILGVYGQWAMIPERVTAGQQTYTVLTSMFLHGGWMHLIGNMLFLYIFGDNVEDELGHAGFLAFYVGTGAAAALAHLAADPASPVPTVGASGAIAGVMGGYLLMFPRARVDVLLIVVFIIRIIPVPAFLMLGVWFGIQVVSGVAVDTSRGGVAYWAHAGGFAAGALGLLPSWLRRGGPAFWRRTHGTPPHPEARYARTAIPIVPRRR